MKFLSLFVFVVVLAAVLAAPATKEKKSIGRKIKHSPLVQITGQKALDCLPNLVTTSVDEMALNGVLCAGDIAYGAAQGVAISTKKYAKKLFGKKKD